MDRIDRMDASQIRWRGVAHHARYLHRLNRLEFEHQASIVTQAHDDARHARQKRLPVDVDTDVDMDVDADVHVHVHAYCCVHGVHGHMPIPCAWHAHAMC